MAGWTNLTPSAAALASGNAYLFEDAGALKYQGTSGSAVTVVNANSTLPSSGGGASFTMLSGARYISQNQYFAAAAGATATNNRTYYLPFYVSTTTTFDRIGFKTGTYTSSGNVRLGIYNNSSSNKPDTVLLDAGTVNVTAATTVYDITINQSLSAGVYWLAINKQNTNTFQIFSIPTTSSLLPFITYGNINSTFSTEELSYYEDSITGAFATAGTLTGTSGGGLAIPVPFLRKA